MNTILIARWLTAFILPTILWLGDCKNTGPPPLDLTALTPLTSPITYETVSLRVAMAAVISPQGTVESYAPLLQYIETNLNSPVELVQRVNHAEIIDLLAAGLVEVVFLSLLELIWLACVISAWNSWLCRKSIRISQKSIR